MLLRRIFLHELIAWPSMVSLAYATRSLPGFRLFFEALEPGYFLPCSAAFVIALNAAYVFLVPLILVVGLSIYPADEAILRHGPAVLLGALLGTLGRALAMAANPRRAGAPRTLRPTTWTPTPPDRPALAQRPTPSLPPKVQRPNPTAQRGIR
jgi:hypothetical protein